MGPGVEVFISKGVDYLLEIIWEKGLYVLMFFGVSTSQPSDS
jgi:hypothetical protein